MEDMNASGPFFIKHKLPGAHASSIRSIMKFRKEIENNGVKREYHFHLFQKGITPVFLVYFQDGDGGPVAFTMEKGKDGLWHVLPQVLPEWTTGAKLHISDAINDYLSSNDDTESSMSSSWSLLG
jgi:hypothetical protein